MLLALLSRSATAQPDRPPLPPADTVYVGTLITMERDAPVAEAIAVRGEVIVAVGSTRDMMRWRGRNTRIVQLGRSALLPGFIDAHGHLTATAAVARYANLASPPSGAVRSMKDLQEAIRRQMARVPSPDQWVVGFGYDDSLIAEKRHPTRADLDAISTSRPIFLVHVSAHISVANSRLLALAGIDASTPDPVGGVIRRETGSLEPNGVLEEAAHMGLYARMPQPAAKEELSLLTTALDTYARSGITTVQDGAASAENLALLTQAAKLKFLKLDVVAYRLWLAAKAPFPAELAFGNYVNRLKICGVKIILDGSPQAKTAWLSEPYLVPPPGQPATYRGYPTMTQEVVARAAHEALSRHVPLLAHANGDAAEQSLLDAVAAARRDTLDTTTPVVMIHAQTVRDDQLDRMKALGVIPSFFVAHTFYWGDWHRDQTLGSPRAERISPTKSALDRGIAFTLHNDSPIVPPDIIHTLWSAATRRTRSGQVLGPEQRITVAQAIGSVTINAARQQGEEDQKGSLRAGKRADFVILSQNPLTTDPERLLDLRILQTISHGQTVYRARP